MKKIIVLFLSFIFVSSLAGCSINETDVDKSDIDENQIVINSGENEDSDTPAVFESDLLSSSTLEVYLPESNKLSEADAIKDPDTEKSNTFEKANNISVTESTPNNVSSSITTSKPSNTPAPIVQPTATPTPKPISTSKPSNICPICDRELEADGSCITIHNYTGYGWQEYDEASGIVYIVCDTCGQKWNRNTYSEPRDWVYDHALACYNKANECYMECGYCGQEWPESRWSEMYRGQYCSRECAMATGYYCPNCESGLYMDGCHNCGYKEICSKCGKEQDGSCLKQYCTVCKAHTDHGAEIHCSVCGSTEHTSHPVCSETEHTIEGACAACGKVYVAPKCGDVGHSIEGVCPICNSSYSTPTCDAEGHTVDGICSVCGITYSTSERISESESIE